MRRAFEPQSAEPIAPCSTRCSRRCFVGPRPSWCLLPRKCGEHATQTAGSVHLLEWPEIGDWRVEALETRWTSLRDARDKVTEAIEPLRRDKIVRSSLEAEVTSPVEGDCRPACRTVHRRVSRQGRCGRGDQVRQAKNAAAAGPPSRGFRRRRLVQPLRRRRQWRECEWLIV